MNFKLWLELTDPKIILNAFEWISPDVLIDESDIDTFIYEFRYNTLYVEDSYTTHQGIINKQYIPDWENCLYGRFGEINKRNFEGIFYDSKYPEIEKFLPIPIITFWKQWGFYSPKSGDFEDTNVPTSKLIDVCVNVFAQNSFKEIIGNLSQKLPIPSNSVVVDHIRPPHYLNDALTQNIADKKYSIKGLNFTTSDIYNWMGKLHFLPPTSPERQTIAHYAELIANSQYAQEFLNFTSRVNFKIPIKRSPWKQELQKQGLLAPGHSIHFPTSESNQ